MNDNSPVASWRYKIYRVIYEAETLPGKIFDVGLIATIIISTVIVLLESVDAYGKAYGEYFRIAEWFITIVFTIEYVLRIISLRRPVHYTTSFYGIVDLLAILPTYIELILPGTHYLMVIRILRILRVFRVLKLTKYLQEGRIVMQALRASRRKIAIFLYAVLTIVVIIGSLMYMIEGRTSGFTSIPKAIYWAIVTLTTVGYGDIAPQTPVGQFLASLVMILGYAIIAVPTGIVTVEMSEAMRKTRPTTRSCHNCSFELIDADALYCKRCGTKLPEDES
jgi:voltage-gated potassium channel